MSWKNQKAVTEIRFRISRPSISLNARNNSGSSAFFNFWFIIKSCTRPATAVSGSPIAVFRDLLCRSLRSGNTHGQRSDRYLLRTVFPVRSFQRRRRNAPRSRSALKRILLCWIGYNPAFPGRFPSAIRLRNSRKAQKEAVDLIVKP